MFGKPKAVQADHQLQDFYIEPKIDGFRVRFDVHHNGKVAVAVGRIRDYTHHFSHLQFPASGVFDAEVVVNGSLQETSKVLSRKDPVSFNRMDVCIFDILQFGARRVDHESYLMRRGILGRLNWKDEGSDLPSLVPSGYADGINSAGELAKFYIDAGYEGIVAKHPSSPYGEQWFKYKKQTAEDFLVTGFQEGKGEWAGSVGAIELQEMHGGKTVGMCSVGSDVNRKWFTDALDQAYVKFTASVTVRPQDRALMSQWLSNAGIIVEVEYQQRTADGKLRHPRLLRIRHDLMPSEVVK